MCGLELVTRNMHMWHICAVWLWNIYMNILVFEHLIKSQAIGNKWRVPWSQILEFSYWLFLILDLMYYMWFKILILYVKFYASNLRTAKTNRSKTWLIDIYSNNLSIHVWSNIMESFYRPDISINMYWCHITLSI